MMWQVRQKLVDLAFSIWFSKPSTPQNAGSTSTEMNAIILPPRGRALSGLMTITTTSAAAITRSPTTKPVGINPPSPLNGDLLLETANELHQFLNLIVGELLVVGRHFVFAFGGDFDQLSIGHFGDFRAAERFGVQFFAHGGVPLAVSPMADRALVLVQRGRVLREHRGRKTDDQNTDHHDSPQFHLHSFLL